MLNLSKCVMNKTRELPFVAGHVVREEGMPIVALLVDGKECIKTFEAADKAAGARFLGFSYSETLTPQTATDALKVTLDANGQAQLAHEPITGQISVWENVAGVRTKVTLDGSDNKVEGKILTVKDGENKNLEVVYQYAPTFQDLMFEHRVLIPTVSSAQMTSSIGVIFDGEVWTDKFDASVDFADPANVKLQLNAAGMITAGATVDGDNLEIANATVIGAPNGNNGFLGLRLNG